MGLRLCRLVTLAVAFGFLAGAAADSGSSSDNQAVDVFDEDVELTPKDWSRFYLACGVMRLSADGAVVSWFLVAKGNVALHMAN